MSIDVEALEAAMEASTPATHPVDLHLERLVEDGYEDAARLLRAALQSPYRYTTAAVASFFRKTGANIGRGSIEYWRRREGCTKAALKEGFDD